MDDSTIEALGKANAIICLQSALVATLVTNGVLTLQDAATVGATADAALARMQGLSEEVRTYAAVAILGFVRSYTTRIRRN